MSIKTLKAQITQLQAQIWRNREYLRHTQKQLALIYRATPATGHRSRQQLRALRAAIAAAMDYDLRWVYRLHARGLAAGAEPQDKREH